jgi:spore coat polysaccharide biosynthesis protein SpsF
LKTVAIIQARMGSSRLPGKVLLNIHGEPMLGRVVRRARKAATVDQVVVATTTDLADDPVADLCEQQGYPHTRGSLQDVLDRYYQAARQFEVEIIVRLTADCPLLDPGLVDQTVRALFTPAGAPETPSTTPFPLSPVSSSPTFDFAANRLPPPWKRTYPIGLDVEVCTFAALERAWREASQPYQREHVMPYLYMGALGAEGLPVFRVKVIDYPEDHGSLRWTVDTPEDLELVREVYRRLGEREDFTWLDVLALFEQDPSLAQINAGVQARLVSEVDERKS